MAMDRLKELVRTGQYDAARQMLRKSKHPKKAELLAHIDKLETRSLADAPDTSNQRKKNAPKAKPKRSGGGASLRLVLLLLVVVAVGGLAAVALGPQLLGGAADQPSETTYESIPAAGRENFEAFMVENYNNPDHSVSGVILGSLERYYGTIPADQAQFERAAVGPNARLWCVQIDPPVESYGDQISRFTVEQDKNGWRTVERYEHPKHRQVYEGACGTW